MTSSGLRTPSLRRRVTLVVLLLLAVMLAVLAVTTDVVLRSRLESQLNDRLVDRAEVGVSLGSELDPADLAKRLEGNGISVLLLTRDGQAYAEGPPPAGDGKLPGAPASPTGAPAARPTPPQATTGDTVTRDGDVLQITRSVGNGATLLLSADAGEVTRTVDQARIALLAGAAAVLLLAALVIGPVVAGALRPLQQITGLARAIRQGDRGERLRPDRPQTELGTTAQAFDDMLDAVEGAQERSAQSERRLREFLSDAAHELRTPVAGIQAASEHLLRANPSRAEREQTLVTVIRESRRAGRLVEDMLLMARIDQGLELRPTTVDLAQVARTAVANRMLRHPDADLAVMGESTLVEADADRVAQVVGNLLDNALRACGPAGRVRVEVGPEAGVIEVVDDGPGIPLADRDRVFERLVRLDSARTPRSCGVETLDGGAGLGLPIARAHGGDLVALEPAAGVGARLRLTLPVGRTTATAVGAVTDRPTRVPSAEPALVR